MGCTAWRSSGGCALAAPEPKAPLSDATHRTVLQKHACGCAQRGWRVLEAVNAELRPSAAEGRLSYADLVALGGIWPRAPTF